jgi:pimeloyl-ACP methyl ester carboxylesterase
MTARTLRIRSAPDPGLHVRLWGRSPPTCFLIHGFGEGSFVWENFARSLHPQGVAAIDLRGHGDSDHDADQRYGIGDHVADTLRTVREMQLDGFVLVGHSMGASIALQVATQLKGRVRALVIVDGGPDPTPGTMNHIRDQFRRQRWHYNSVQEYASHLVTLLPLAPEALLHDLAGQALRSCADGGFELKCDRGLADAPLDVDDAEMWSALRALECPVLIVRGAASAGVSRTCAEKMMTQIRRGELRTVPFAGHAVMIDNPSGFCSALRDFCDPLKE